MINLGKSLLPRTCFLLLCLFMTGTSMAQYKAKVIAGLDPGKEINTKNIWLVIRVCNQDSVSLSLPENLRVGLNKDPFAAFILEIEKKNEHGGYFPFRVTDEYLPVSDSGNMQELKSGDTILRNVNIAFATGYQCPEGIYRVRVLLTAARFNKRAANTWSNWTEFRITRQ